MGIRLRTLGYLLLAASLLAGAGLAVGIGSMWAADIRFGPFDSYISELSVGPAPAPRAFVVMIVGLALFTGIFFLLAPHSLERDLGAPKGALQVARAFGIVGTGALLAMVFFPLNPGDPSTYATHIVLAIVAFYATSGEMSAFVRVLGGQTGVLRWAQVAALLCAPFTFAFGTLTILVEIAGLLRASSAVFLVEWLAFSFFAAWIVLTGVGLVKRD